MIIFSEMDGTNSLVNINEQSCKTHDSSQGFIFRNGRFDRYFRVEYVSEHVYWADASPVYELRGVMCTQVYDDNVMNTAEKMSYQNIWEYAVQFFLLCSLIVELVLGRLPR